ncbi:MAG: SDR family oxidoreductase [Deltaproteobacteria bacterium]|nr:MAG: SDR family oxidoreductase [Deltaproteobacteria bacterium]
MQGRVCVVTGASSGIGRATALALGRLGATLGLVCRDRARGDALVAEVRAASGHDRVGLFVADLASRAAVHGLAGELRAAYPRVHVLVNNAGVVNLRYSETVDGIETVFAVNHLAPFLLTHLLLGRLAESGSARIVNVASDAHRWGRIDFDDLGRRRRYRGIAVYAQSKLANLLFTYELARRLDGVAITANCLHPGAVATGLGHNNGFLARLVAGALRPFFRTAEQGAATSIYLASAPEADRVSGRYFVDCREARSSPASYDESLARRLWEVSARMTGVPA